MLWQVKSMSIKTRIRLGYVAMSVNVKNASPSQTMTFKRFQQLPDKDAATFKLEQIARSNLNNCLRLLKHNLGHGISFFRLSSRLVPLATHPELKDWHYLSAIKEELKTLGDFAREHHMRLDFHPDHFNVINTPNKETFKATVKTLGYHLNLLRGMGIGTKHRLVMHVGGVYQDKPKALERFVDQWSMLPSDIQEAIIIENDDKSFDLMDCLYLCEKLGAPLVFDLHHHMANACDDNWRLHWHRIIKTWNGSPHPVKMHISSPKSDNHFRHHADYVNPDQFLAFLREIDGTVPQLDCMIEAKQKDGALFQLLEDLNERQAITNQKGATFFLS